LVVNLYQHVTTELFEQIIKENLQEKLCPEPIQDKITITIDEENTIWYMAGYVLHKLKIGMAIGNLMQKEFVTLPNGYN